MVRDTTPTMAMSRGNGRGLIVTSELLLGTTFWVRGLFVGLARDAAVRVPPSTLGGAFFRRLRRKLTSMDLRVSKLRLGIGYRLYRYRFNIYRYRFNWYNRLPILK